MTSSRAASSGNKGWPICALIALLCLVSNRARGHDLALDQLLLRSDIAQREVVGQLTFNPHRTPDREGPGARDLSARVIALVQRSIRLEVDGQRCQPRIEVRELWATASPTVGDLLILHCATPRPPRSLRVFAEEDLPRLVVTVEDSRTPAGSRSVLISAGSWTPLYVFAEPDNEWLPGGAARFENGDAASRALPTAAPNAIGPSRAPAPRSSPAGIGFGERLSEVARRYLWLGYRHILPEGGDHVLFVAGLVLGSFREWRRLLWQISAFTLAHTLTLALGALGWVVLPKSLVEPLIAFSIAYVAIENLRPRGSSQLRLLVVFGFGLVHGQGFARALDDVGLKNPSFLVALAAFNLGVELGQLSIIVLLSVLIHLLRRATWGERWVLRPASLGIAVIGLLWGVERLFS